MVCVVFICNFLLDPCVPSVPVQLDEVLRREGKAEVMAGHVDQFLSVVLMQLHWLSSHMGDAQLPPHDVFRLYSCLLGTMLSVRACLSSLIQCFSGT